MSAWRHSVGGYVAHAPPPVLADCAEAVWLHCIPPDLDGGGATHRVLPDPSPGLAFTYTRCSDGRVSDPRIIVVGPVANARLYTFGRGREMAAVRLKLEWAGPLLGVVPSDHVDALDDFGTLSPTLAERLLDALVRTRTAHEAAGVLVDALVRLRARAAVPDPLAAAALDRMRASRGCSSVEHVAHALGVAERTLRRRVRIIADTSIKAFGRARRFLHLLERMDAQASPNWARLAAETGFFDQSHLARDLRHFAGLPPEHLHSERRAEAVFS